MPDLSAVGLLAEGGALAAGAVAAGGRAGAGGVVAGGSASGGGGWCGIVEPAVDVLLLLEGDHPLRSPGRWPARCSPDKHSSAGPVNIRMSAQKGSERKQMQNLT